MYLKVDLLGDEIYTIVKKRKGDKDLYELDEILRAIIDEIDALDYEIHSLKEELSNLKSDDIDLEYERMFDK